MSWIHASAAGVEILDEKPEVVDQLLAAAVELEWAETRALAAIEGARAARVSWLEIAEAFELTYPESARKLVEALRRRAYHRSVES